MNLMNFNNTIIYKSLILGISFEKLDTILDLHPDDMIRIFGETRYSNTLVSIMIAAV